VSLLEFHFLIPQNVHGPKTAPIMSGGNVIQFFLALTSMGMFWQPEGLSEPPDCQSKYIQGGADKSLAQPGRKQVTVTRLGIYSTYTPRSSIHFLARCSNFCKALKKNSEGCPSNQVSAAAMTSVSDEKWRPFNCFFQSKEQVVIRRGQIQRVGWVIKTLEAQVGQFLLGCKCPVSRGIVMHEQDPLGDLPVVFSFKMSFNCTNGDE